MATRLSVEELLDQHDEPVRQTTLAVVATIERVAPDLRSKVLPGWRAVGFSSAASGFLCAVFPYPDRVDIAFEVGHRLDDPAGVLHSGKNARQVRYWSLAPGEAPDEDLLESFLEQSAALKEVRR
jgi:hypothetical protein